MRSIHETKDFLQTAFEVVEERMEQLRQEGADARKVARLKWRQQLISEALKAVEEVQALSA